MTYVCSRCHTHLQGEGEGGGDPPHRCTQCGAEAGLEVVKTDVPPAMRYFGFIVAGAAVAALSGSIVSRLAG